MVGHIGNAKMWGVGGKVFALWGYPSCNDLLLAPTIKSSQHIPNTAFVIQFMGLQNDVDWSKLFCAHLKNGNLFTLSLSMNACA